MVGNYFKLFLATLRRHRIHSAIKMLGLALALSVALLTALYIQYEWSYDRFHRHPEQIYRVEGKLVLPNGQYQYQAVTPLPLGPYLAKHFPQVQFVSRIYKLPSALHMTRPGLAPNNENGGILADDTVFNVFTYTFLQGSASSALQHPDAIVLTRQMADIYFPDENPIGKELVIEHNYPFRVTAVIADPPRQTHLPFRYILPFSQYGLLSGDTSGEGWQSSRMYTYLRLRAKVNPGRVQERLKGLLLQQEFKSNKELYLKPLSHIHLYSRAAGEFSQNSDIKHIYSLSIIAGFILLVAGLNYVNLTTAYAVNRFREVGIRKTLGAHTGKLLLQFIVESMLMAVLANIIALMLVEVFISEFNRLAGTQIVFRYAGQWRMVLVSFALALLVGFLSGAYPAVLMASYQPNRVLRGLPRGALNALVRKVLVVFQFTVSIGLIVATIVVFQQVRFMKAHSLPPTDYHLLVIDFPCTSECESQRITSFKQDLLAQDNVVNVSFSYGIPFGKRGTSLVNWQGVAGREKLLVNHMYIDENFLDTFSLQVLRQSPDFARILHAEPKEWACIINETAAISFGWVDPVGQRVISSPELSIPVIAVVKDFHYSSLENPIEPLILLLRKGKTVIYPPSFTVKIYQKEADKTIERVGAAFARHFPELPYDYWLFDRFIQSIYAEETRLGNSFLYFSLLGTLIASLGLYGLVSFMVQRRVREIGIRKTLGASNSNIIGLLIREQSVLILLANLLAWPLAYVIMSRWLGRFSFHVSLSFCFFMLAGAFTFLVSMATILPLAWRAAKANPVDSLRYE